MNFDQAVEIILKKEGGYVNHPKDPGGETNFGISKRSYPDLDIKNLTKEMAKEIYYRDYWDKINLHLLPQGLNLIVFDCAVNQGPLTAINLLQECISVPSMAKFSMDDLEKVEEVGLRQMIAKYSKKRKARYIKNKNYGIFGTGWLDRLLEITIESFLSVK